MGQPVPELDQPFSPGDELPVGLPEGMVPPQQQDPFANKRPFLQSSLIRKNITRNIPAEFGNMTPADMERRRAEEMSKAESLGVLKIWEVLHRRSKVKWWG